MSNATIEIISQVSDRDLKINYQCQTNRVSYSIADVGGHLLKRGNCHEVKDSKIDISDLPKGLYTFCIVDGADLIKLRFQKDQ